MGKGSSFAFAEATISGIHAAMQAGELTAQDLVTWYLQRIAKFDQTGPTLRAVIRINQRAQEEAAKLDAALSKSGLVGPLHGIPVLLKDNVETRDMLTTAGSLSLADFQPDADAFIVRRLRRAGAIILAKTNLHEFAIWGETTSSVGGQTVNPYDLTRTPGGSSGGTGAGIAANFGVVGIGTDTINSVRSPASANSLVGVRPTLGLVSRAGIVPYSLTQDTAGPICRTVADAAIVLAVIAGYDADDAVTAWAYGQGVDYPAALRVDGLRGKKIGVLESFFGTEPIHAEVSARVRQAIAAMRDNGATIISVQEPIDAGYLTTAVSVHLYDFKADLNAYLRKHADKVRYHTLAEIIQSGKFHPTISENIRQAEQLSVDGLDYKQRRFLREQVRTQVMKLMADYELDAVVFPHQKRPVVPVGEVQVERNGVLGSVTGFPSVVVPAGFTAPTATAPHGIPVGMEILGRPFSEAVLLEIAYAFEQSTNLRRPPQSTPF